MKTRILHPKDLREHDLETRIDLVQNAFGIKDEEIKNMTGKRFLCGTEYRIIEAAEIVYKALVRQGIDKATALMHISGSLIESLIGTENDYKLSVEGINKGITQYFKAERKNLIAQTGTQINSPSILRKIIYEEQEGKNMLLNAEESTKIWGSKLKFSDNDLARGIQIPKIGLEQSILYGVATAGTRIENKTEGTHTISFNYFGNEEKKWMFETIIPIISRTFKVDKNSIIRNGNGQDFGNGRNRPITIHSKVIEKFFSEYLGFSRYIEERHLINIKKIKHEQLEATKKEINLGNLAGILAKRMPITQNGKTYQGKITLSKNPILAKEISEYSQQLGFYNRLIGNGTRVIFPEETLYKLAKNKTLDGLDIKHKGLLLRADQYQKLF